MSLCGRFDAERGLECARKSHPFCAFQSIRLKSNECDDEDAEVHSRGDGLEPGGP